MAPIPIVVCGHKEEIAQAVKKALEPEFETVYVVYSTESGKKVLPSLLSGKGLPSDAPHDPVGTQNFTNGVATVGAGGTYTDEDIKALRDAVGSASKIPWMRPDNSKPVPPVGPAWGTALATRAKELYARLVTEDKTHEDGVYFY